MNIKHIVIITIIMLLLCSGTASAWLSGYDHRMAITVNNGGAATLNYYQFNFTNDTNTLVAAGHMQASGADCRVTDSSDNLIPFWNEMVFNAAGTKIWANATTLMVGDNIFYMYYGNSFVSSVVSGNETFLRYDVGGIRGFWKQDEASWTGAIGEVKDETTVNNGTLTNSATTTDGVHGNAGNYSTIWGGVDCGTDTSLNLATYGFGWLERASGTDDMLLELGVHNGKLYATTFDLAYLWEWDNVSTWTQVAPKYGTSRALYGIVSYHGDLYVGSHSTAGGGGELLMWNGVDDWVLKAPQHSGENEIRCNLVYNDKIYGGTWEHAKLFEWNGVDAWIEVAPQYDALDRHIVDLIEFGGSMYGCTEPSGRLQLWNGVDAWIEVAGSIGKGVYALEEYNGKIYGSTGTDATLVEWNGVDAWVEVAPQYDSGGTVVRDLSVFDGALYGGVDGNGQLLKWNNVDAWELVCDQFGTHTRISTLEEYGGELYGGGTDGTLLRMELGSGALDNTHFSLETWMRPFELGRRQSLIDKHNDNYFLTTWTDDTLRFILRGLTDDSMYSTTVFSTGDLNKWHHIVCTYNGTHSAIYINGTLDNTEPTTGTLIINDAKPVVLGFETAGINAFNGSLDETRVWARGLNSDEVELLYNNYLERMGDAYNIRKYTSSEPSSSLGAEEDAPATDNDITLGANQHGLLRKNVLVAETFSTIAAGIDHDQCYTWWDITNDRWESYRVGYSYNAAESVPEHDPYFVLMDGIGTTISCSIASAETVVIPAGYYTTYLRESTNKPLSEIKTDMGGNVIDLWAFDSTTGAWTDTGTYSVLPNQGLMLNSSTGFNWDGAVP